jgi:hypothetical protein
MGKLGLNSGYIGSDQRTTTNGVVGYDKFYLERKDGRFLPVLDGDPDALAFFARVTAAGGSLSATEKSAVNTLVVQMKADGTWTPMKAIYPMVGASAAACAQNLKSSSFTGTFSSGWTFASTGVTPNGTSAYMDTNFLPSTSFTNNNTHISVYSRTNASVSSACLIGTGKNSNAIPLITLYSRDVADQYMMDAYSYSGNRIITISTLSSAAFFINSRISSTVFKSFRNGTQLGATNTATNSNDITTCDKAMYIGALNFNGSAAQFSNYEQAFASIGDGLTDTQASNFYTAVQAFQTTLSRQV